MFAPMLQPLFKNLLDEKGIQYHYVDVSKIPPELLKYFSTFNETLEPFKDI